MRLFRILTFVLILPLVSRGDTTAEFRAMLDHYYDEYATLFPVDAAINGDQDPRLARIWQDDISADHRAKVIAWCDRYLGALAHTARAELGPSDRISYDILMWELTTRRDGTRHFLHLLPVNQFESPTLTFAQMASGAYIHPFRTAADYRDFLSVAAGYSTWVDTAIANLREGVRKGVVSPRVLMERVLVQLDPLIVDDPATNILFGPLQNLPDTIAEPERARLQREYGDAVRQVMIPAYRRLRDFIRDEYLSQARETAGWNVLPGGKEAYAWLVRWQTTTDLRPDEIHAIGLREVARIEGEMSAVQAKVGFHGTLTEFLNFVATDSRFTPFKTDAEVLDAYRAIEGRVMKAVPRFFGRMPRTRFEIRETEKFRAASASAEYIAGTADGSRPGIFYVPIVDPTTFRTPRMEDLFLHEAIPGHHFQLSLALENPDLPRFRRFESSNAFVEGWALYSESLGAELGLYSDPYQYLGMLLGDMHRAVRLVVDTGIHSLGWSRQQALAYGAAHEGGSPETQAAEVERYMAWPGQALGYKIGQIRIRDLRDRAQRAQGAAFNLAAFHDEILREGAMPLAVLDAHMTDWLRR
ncbi:MAG TPA: DUF885 domain-containing protein [Candidatus Didemnitutus sp.]|nr:DUF885 domain-containing protein [Candidatus Didemnitutus sp.]